MSDTPLLRVFCSRMKHVVGTVHWDGAYELHYKASVRVGASGNERDDIEAADRIYRADAGRPSPGFDAYCAVCRRRLFVPVDQVFHSALNGKTAFRLQGRNAEARFKPRGSPVD